MTGKNSVMMKKLMFSSGKINKQNICVSELVLIQCKYNDKVIGTKNDNL